MREELIPKRSVLFDEKKLSNMADEAAALAAMKETRGFKILYQKFIEPRTSLERIYAAQGADQQVGTIAAVHELDLLMKFINGSITDGQKANEELETLRKSNGR